jgi:hypothetical protein
MNYLGNKNTPMADLTMAKLLIYSTISTPWAKFLGFNLANFYHNTPCQTPNTCISVLTSSPAKSLFITTFATMSLLMNAFTLVFPKPASLQARLHVTVCVTVMIGSKIME